MRDNCTLLLELKDKLGNLNGLGAADPALGDKT